MLNETNINNYPEDELGTCDNCGRHYPLSERSVTGTTTIRCGDCGNCSNCCPPEHPRDNLVDDVHDLVKNGMDHDDAVELAKKPKKYDVYLIVVEANQNVPTYVHSADQWTLVDKEVTADKASKIMEDIDNLDEIKRDAGAR